MLKNIWILLYEQLIFFQIGLSIKNPKFILAMLMIILCLSKPSEPRYLNYRSRTSFRSLKQWLNVKSIIFQNDVNKPADPNSFGSNPANLTSGLTSYQIANLNAWWLLYIPYSYSYLKRHFDNKIYLAVFFLEWNE